MKIGLQTWGSHGDIRPFVALAEGLQAAGHEVTLALTCVDSDRYAALQTTASFTLRLVATPLIADRPTLEAIGAAILRERNAIRQTRRVIEDLLLPAEASMREAAERLCADNELLIGHYFSPTLGIAAEKHGRPFVSIALAHGGIPSAHVPPIGVPNLGRVGNRLAWRLARWMLNRSLKQYPDRLRAAQGLPPARDLLESVWASETLTLLAVSPTLCPRQADWPAHIQVCGALDTADSVAEGSVPESLRAFLAAGAAPVFLTLGSMMAGSDLRRTVALLTDAAQQAAVRAVVQVPETQRLGLVSDAQLHFVSAAPHAAVFPFCRAVVHHGGAGTSQAVLRAGVPSVVLPHTVEQELWGRELERIGVAGKSLLRRDLTARGLAAAIRQVVQTEALQASAKRVGAQVAQEDGVATAVRLLGERLAG